MLCYMLYNPNNTFLTHFIAIISSLTSRDKTKTVIPEAPIAESLSFSNAEEVVESPIQFTSSRGPCKSKFNTPQSRFSGSGYSLRGTNSETPLSSSSSSNLTGSGFRRLESSLSRSDSTRLETRFSEKDRNEHFQGTGHRLN